MKTSAILLGAGIALFIFGCQSSGNDSSANNSTGTTSTAGDTGAAASTTAGAATSAATTSTTGSATTGGLTATANFAAVQSIINSNCMPCHSASSHRAGLDLSSYDSLMKGARGKPVIKTGDPNGSLMVQYINGAKKPQMPMNRAPLSAPDVKTITDWIQSGAKNS